MRITVVAVKEFWGLVRQPQLVLLLLIGPVLLMVAFGLSLNLQSILLPRAIVVVELGSEGAELFERFRDEFVNRTTFVGTTGYDEKVREMLLAGEVDAVIAIPSIPISPELRSAYVLLTDPPLRAGESALAMLVVSLLAGFLAFLVGGYVAARQARVYGGAHGAMTAVLGLVAGAALAAVLATSGALVPGGVAITHAVFGLSGAALPAGMVLFVVDLFGGYVGRKLGEPFPRIPNPR